MKRWIRAALLMLLVATAAAGQPCVVRNTIEQSIADGTATVELSGK